MVWFAGCENWQYEDDLNKIDLRIRNGELHGVFFAALGLTIASSHFLGLFEGAYNFKNEIEGIVQDINRDKKVKTIHPLTNVTLIPLPPVFYHPDEINQEAVNRNLERVFEINDSLMKCSSIYFDLSDGVFSGRGCESKYMSSLSNLMRERNLDTTIEIITHSRFFR